MRIKNEKLKSIYKNERFREKERPDPAQYCFANLYGEIVAKLDGHIAGQQFIIEKCKVSFFLIIYTSTERCKLLEQVKNIGD